MPEIPRFIIERDAPGPGSISLPEIRQTDKTIAVAGAVGKAISEAGEAAGSLTTNVLKLKQELAEKERRALENAAGIETIFESQNILANKAVELRTRNAITADEEFLKFSRKFLNELPSRKELKDVSQEGINTIWNKTAQFAFGQLQDLKGERTKAIIAYNQGVLDNVLKIQKDRYVQARIPEEQRKILEETEALTKTNVITGIFTTKKGEDIFTGFVKNAEFERASVDFNRDPGLFLTKDLRKEYPLIADAEQYNKLQDRANKEFRDREKRLEEQSKAIRQALIDTLETRAVSSTGNLRDEELDAHIANNDIEPDEATKIRKLRDDSGIRRATDPVVVAEFQRDILENPTQEIKDRIIAHKNIASEKKLELVEQIKRFQTARSDPNHFSNTPAFRFVKSEIDRAITGGGLLGGVNERERAANAQLELWNRVEKGEDSIKIMPDIIKRWKRGPLPQVVGGPRFRTEDDLAKALESKTITNQEFLEEINRLRSLDGGDTE